MRRLLPLAVAAVLAACAASKPDPQPLEPLTPSISVAPAWTRNIEAVQFPLEVAVNAGRFTVAGNDGTVVAIEAASGREIWRTSVGAKLGAGVGSDGRYAAVVSRDGELYVLDQGQAKWHKPMGGRVATAPLVAGERVFVLGVDRAVQAFDAASGRKLWTLRQPGDPLTLAQAGVLAAFKNTLLVGQGPRLAGVDPNEGTVKWDVVVGSPRGANEIERLADLVGPALRLGDAVCARSFQAAVGCVDAERGTALWSRNVGGTDAAGGDREFVFAADATDRITAWKASGGEVAWTSDKLLYRGLSAPLATPKSVVFGDEKGMLHWLARDTGTAQLRTETDGGAIVAQPVMTDGTALFVTRKGGLYAFRP